MRDNQLNPRYLAKCGVDTPDQTCTIGRTRTVTITADFGASVAGVTAGIGVANAEAIAIQIGCQSPKMGTGQEYLAFPTERHFSYRVVSDDEAYVSDSGEYVSDGMWSCSPVAMTAAFDEGFRCRVQRQPS